MSHKVKTTVKQRKERDDKKSSQAVEHIDEDVQPWKNVFRPTCAEAPKDNSFVLDDESTAAAVEAVLSACTVSDPPEEGNSLCYVSPGFVTTSGYNENECLGRNSMFLQSGKSEPGFEILRSGLDERHFAAAEVTALRKDGRAFQDLVSVVPVLDEDGNTLLHSVAVHCDLDERRRRGETTDDSFAAKWQEQVKHYISAFALIDVSAGSRGPGSPAPAAVCAVSPGFASMTGYRQSDVLGWNMLCLCGPDSSERDMRKLITSQWSHSASAVKLLCYKRDGTPFWALLCSFPLTSVPPAPAVQPSHAPTGRGLPGGAASPVSARSGATSGAARVGAALGLVLAGNMPGGAGAAAGGLLVGLNGVAAGLFAGAASSGGGAASPGLGPGSPASGGGAAPAGPVVKYVLCCVVDITAQRLKRVGKYVLGKVIGAGAFGMVRIGKNSTTDELVAVKGVDATRFRSITEIEQIQEEMSVLSSLKHPHIIRLHDVHFQSNTFYLVMEFAGGGSLVQFMRRHDPVRHCLDEETSVRVFTQMFSALDYCHRRRVVHRDLKPENILMDEKSNLKIADFGLAAVAAPFNGGLTLQCGTPEFTAPEITIGREYEGASVDIWSMGVILYEALTGTLPFKGANQPTLFKAIQRGVYDPLPSHYSPECKDLVRRMLTVDPTARITMDEILRHPWLNGGGGGGRLGRGAATEGASQTAVLGVPREGSDAAPLSPCPRSNERINSLLGSQGTGSRPASAAWRENGMSGGERPRVSDNGRLCAVMGLGSRPASRPASTSMSGGPTSGAKPLGSESEGGGGIILHDSVRLVIPSASTDRDDPILAAILRGGHGHVASMDSACHSPARANGMDEDEAEGRGQPGSASYSPVGLVAGGGAGARRDSTPSGARMGANARSLAGHPAANNPVGHGQAGGKARGGALLPTLGSGALSPAANGVLDRRLQDPSRFRSPARTPGGAGADRTTTARSTGRAASTSQPAVAVTSPGSSPHLHAQAQAEGSTRQLPPIQTARGMNKKSSWVPGNVS